MHPVFSTSYLVLLFVLSAGMLSLLTSKAFAQELPVEREAFRQVVDGKPVDLYVLQNSHGMKVAITNYGGRLVSWLTPDREGRFDDIVLGFESLDAFRNAGSSSYGATIGRYANRIAEGRFTLDGQVYELDTNSPPNHIHGGRKGFYHRVFDAVQLSEQHLRLRYVSEDGEEGYPGRLVVQVFFELTDSNELRISYTAATDKPTVVNLTNHAFYNLRGSTLGPIDDHVLMVDADFYTPVDETAVPTGEVAPVQGTPFDFRQPTTLGLRQDEEVDQLVFVRGYDHNFVLNKPSEEALALAATLYEPESGRFMEVFTTEPGLQVYAGNFLSGADVGKGGAAHGFRYGICLETQHFPDSPNQPHFPSTRLDPGELFHSVTVYRLTAR